MNPRRRSVDRWIAAGIFLCVVVITGLASSRQGVHRDEAVYMEAGERYAAWMERVVRGEGGFSARGAAPYFSCGAACNSEHPPLMKLLYGLSWRVFAGPTPGADRSLYPGGFTRPKARPKSLGWMSEITAFRAPTFLAFGLLAALVYLFFVDALGRRRGGHADDEPTAEARAGALAAALLTVAQPRAFFHAQTASFDLPAATLWFACVYLYWRSLQSFRPLRAALALGVVYGLFLATKLQSFFLPFALGAHWVFLVGCHLLQRRREAIAAVAGALAAPRRPPLPRPTALVALVVVGPLVLLALWPYLWADTWQHLKTYYAFHSGHVHYNFEYLGTNYNNPPFPWHEPLGMLFTTAPVMLLALAAMGIRVLVREALAARRERRRPLAEGEAPRAFLHDPRATRALMAIAAIVPMLPFLTGRAPIFGETKHWLATMPFLALCGGVAVQALLVALAAEHRERWARLALPVTALAVLVVAAPGVVETARSHPYGLSHYNALAGGAPGGADLGMNRQFWGYSPRGLFAELNARLPQGAKIYPHDWSHGAFLVAQRDRLIRRDLKDAGMELPAMRQADVALVVHELHFNKYDYMIWNVYGHGRPSRVLTLDGVPLVSVYERQPGTLLP